MSDPFAAAFSTPASPFTGAQEPAPHTLPVDIERITSIPVRTDKVDVAAFSRQRLLASATAEGKQFLPLQAQAISDFIELFGTGTGGLHPIGVGGGKCAVGETLVYDAEKGMRRMDDLGDFTTVSMSEGSRQLGWHQAFSFQSGQKECLRLHLRSGEETGLSLDHPVYTPEGWKQAQHVAVGDLVACPDHLPEPPEPKAVCSAEVRVLAYLMADGCTRGSGNTLSGMLGPILTEFRESCERLSIRTSLMKEKSKAYRVICGGTKKISQKYGIHDCLSKHKRMPAVAFAWSNADLALFLNRLIATDGHVSKRGIEYCVASKGLALDVQQALLRFGVISRVCYKSAKCGAKRFDAWKLDVSGKPDVLRFFEGLGLLIEAEKECKALLEKMQAVRSNPNTDIVPVARKEVREIAVEMGIPKHPLRETLAATDGQWVSRPKFKEWVAESGYAGEKSWLATGHLRWERVVKKEPLGVLPVYDLTVPTAGNFVANGIIVHNTLSYLAMADYAYRNGIHKIMLLVPPPLVNQLTGRDLRWARTMIPFATPVHCLHGLSAERRKALAHSGKLGIYVFPYSLLSTPDASELIEGIAPGLILCDEAHMLANRQAARTKRLFWYIHARKPLGVALSGTITSKSVRDYHHIATWCLGNNSPLPLSSSMAEEWGNVIDAEATEGNAGGFVSEAAGRVMSPLVGWAHRNFQGLPSEGGTAAFRTAYRLRLNHTKGIVPGAADMLGTSLTLTNRPVEDHEDHPHWPKLAEHINRLQVEMRTPSGDEIEHAIHTWKWIYELSAGFYNNLLWPEAGRLAEARAIAAPEAESILERAKEHHANGQAYSRALRRFLETNTDTEVDTPFKVGGHIHRLPATGAGCRVPGDLVGLWRKWHASDFQGRPDRLSSVVRVCDYKVTAAVEWALSLPKGEGGLIWCHHIEMANWIAEALALFGLTVVCRPGDEEVENPANKHKIMVLTAKKYCEGKNLQHFVHQYVAQWPRSAKVAEQLLGRCHRTGQKADELIVVTNNTLEFDHLNFAAALNDALYIHQSIGTRQKMIYCNYDPEPKVFPSHVLRERGLEARTLDAGAAKAFAEKFALGT